MGAVHAAPDALAEAATAEIVVLAPPVLAVRSLMKELGPSLSPGSIVTDAASTKVDVERWAAALLPGHVEWIGGHPMAGKETAGLEHAEATLFHGRTWCVVPPSGARADSVNRIRQLATDAGATPLEIDAERHDRAVAKVSHLPFMAAAALAHAVIDDDDFESIERIAGTGLRDMTRLASGDPTMHRDIVLTNRVNVVRSLERYVASLEETLALLRALPTPEDAESHRSTRDLSEYFAHLKAARDAWLGRRC